MTIRQVALLSTILSGLILPLFMGVPVMAAAETEPVVSRGGGFVGTDKGMKWLEAEPRTEYASRPLTIECRAKISEARAFNILVSHGFKSAVNHWELYTETATGRLAAYIPGNEPAIITSEAVVTDGAWHILTLVLGTTEVTLSVDGREVSRVASVVKDPAASDDAGVLVIGTALDITSLNLGCAGQISYVHLRRGEHSNKDLLEVPTAETDSVGLWFLGEPSEGATYQDLSTLTNPVRTGSLTGGPLEEIEKASFRPGPGPLDSEPELVELAEGEAQHPTGPVILKLDGVWQMIEGASDESDIQSRLADEWSGSIPATVPGSVHTALWKAGRIPDPYFGLNQAIAREQSYKTWWFRTTFDRPKGASGERLVFDGVCSSATFWLNGKKLGTHLGMFGGPVFDVSGSLEETNTLIVRLDPAPRGEPFVAWTSDVVFNNVYGWHYSFIPSRGIWRSVRVEGAPAVRVQYPFLATRDAKAGVVDLAVDLEGSEAGFDGQLDVTIKPDNFEGKALHFSREIRSNKPKLPLHLRFTVPDPQLWWPVDLGKQNLYQAKVSFTPTTGVADYKETTFAVRTITFDPFPGGPFKNMYNWTFVINGRPSFVKGNGWCTMDSLMDFSRERYERFLTLAASQHIQVMRGWGSGMPETDDFYDLCDRLGIMILQEWPTAWNSHKVQPYDALEETVRLNTLRLRNHPSLAIYGGGNESGDPFGPAIDMMGRYAHELDGTRPFHRTDAWGGSAHNHDAYWYRLHIDFNLSLAYPFFGEFGVPCFPNYESVQRWLPEAEKDLWPPTADGSFAHHTPVFNTRDCMARLSDLAHMFTKGETMQEFIQGSQMASVSGMRHTLELARTRWPECTGMIYYKQNDNYPGASWACIDWYGAAKMEHYFFQDSFSPLSACIRIQKFNTKGQELSMPVFLLDDTEALEGSTWEVIVRAYDGQLNEIKSQSYTGSGAIDRVKQLGEFTLTAQQNDVAPLLTVVEIKKDGNQAFRTFYWTNFEAEIGCMFTLPTTTLTMKADGNDMTIVNTGSKPAVGVNFACPKVSDKFMTEDNFIWLDPGESRTIQVSHPNDVTIDAWNLEGRKLPSPR